MSDFDTSTHPSAWGDRSSDISGSAYGWPAPFADLAALQGDATFGNGSAWGPGFDAGQYVTLHDSSQAVWDGSTWSAFGPVVITPGDTPCVDPGAYTVAEVKAYVDSVEGGCECAATAKLAEIADKNRPRLVAWLDGYLERCDGPDGEVATPVEVD